MSFKAEGMITWSWKEVFWIYWISFSLMIPISVGFFLLFLGKFYQHFVDNITTLEGTLKYFLSINEVFVFKVKGVFTLFFYTCGMTVNSLVSSQNFIQCLDNLTCPYNLLYSSFIYFIVFIVLFVFISFLLRKDIL